MDLEEAQARISELEGQVTALTGERDGAVQLGETLRVQLGETAAARDAATVSVTELTAAREATAAELAAAQQQASEAQAAGLTALRRALLAENAGQVVPELIDGDTAEALTASVEVARSAFQAVRSAAGGAVTVPAGGGSARTASPTAGMSPLEMIASGLGAKGGR